MDGIERLNENPRWREIVGKPSIRLKDQEMILRFMAMLHNGDDYFRPMEEFLNVFTQINRNPDKIWMRDTADLFDQVVKAFADSMGKSAFRVSGGRAVNAAVFDSMSAGLANRIRAGGAPDDEVVREIHNRLMRDVDYLHAITRGTSSERSVPDRLRIAKTAFKDA